MSDIVTKEVSITLHYITLHRTDWGLRSSVVAGPSSWNALPVGSRSSSFGLDTFAKHLKTHLFG